MNPSNEPTLLTAGEFAERVMRAIEIVPAPTPTRTFVAALRARALRDAVAVLWVAWHLGTVRSWHVAPRVRARSFALVFAVSAVLTTGGLAAAAAVHSVVPQRDDRTPMGAPSGSSVDEGPTGNGLVGPEETDETDEADESPATSDEPDETDDDGGAGSTVDRTDDADDGHDGARGGDAVDAEDDDADEAHDGDEHDGGGDADDGEETEDGPGGDDGPEATDDHSGSDDGEEPDESDGPDGSSDGGDAPDSIDDHSESSDGADVPDTAGAEPDD